jgi:ribulose 1,5-bisphosphate synthetase/thiazole synthase
MTTNIQRDQLLIGVRPQARSRPRFDTYDVVIVGRATSGWSIAWHLPAETDFAGKVLVVERGHVAT